MMNLILSSFGFKYGVPTDVTCIWDVRFLPNPYWEESLREKSGLQHDVAAYVLQSTVGKAFFSSFAPLVTFVVHENIKKGQKRMHLAIGCTGGRHRSVAIVEALAADAVLLPVVLTVTHRDLEKEGEK